MMVVTYNNNNNNEDAKNKQTGSITACQINRKENSYSHHQVLFVLLWLEEGPASPCVPPTSTAGPPSHNNFILNTRHAIAGYCRAAYKSSTNLKVVFFYAYINYYARLSNFYILTIFIIHHWNPATTHSHMPKYSFLPWHNEVYILSLLCFGPFLLNYRLLLIISDLYCLQYGYTTILCRNIRNVIAI